MAELDAQGRRVSKRPSGMSEFTWIDGRRYRVVYEDWGDYVRADGKGVIPGIGFRGIVPA